MMITYYGNNVQRMAIVGWFLFAVAAEPLAETRTNAAGRTESSGSIPNAGNAYRYDPNRPNPYTGFSGKELWEQKPSVKLAPHESPGEEYCEKLKAWTRILEDTLPNPYAGKSARQLMGIKPRLRKVQPWPPANEEENHIWQWWHAIQKADPDQEWKMPIEFYGIVVNQSHQPLSGTTIDVLWSAVDGTTPKISKMTGSDGRFAVTNIQGKGVSIVVHKTGCYPFASARQGFEYFDIGCLHTPDPTNPVIFRLWEYSNPEPMYKSDIMPRRMSVDGKVVWVDVKGHVADCGQIGFRVLRHDPTNRLTGYTITIHATEGGGLRLPEPNDELMFLAPSDGYQPQIRLEQLPGNVYSSGRELRFYLRTSDGKYASIRVDISLYNDGTAGMNGLIYYNPSGTRNLQYRDDLRLIDRKLVPHNSKQ